MSTEANSYVVGLNLADSSGGGSHLPLDILIGCDHYWDMVTGSISRSAGWILSGPILSSSSMQYSSTHIWTTHLLQVEGQPTELAQLTEQPKSFWELESLGVRGGEDAL